MTFRYEAFTAKSDPKRGTIEASSEAEAGDKLRETGLILLRLELDGPAPMKTVLNGDSEGDNLVNGAPLEPIPPRRLLQPITNRVRPGKKPGEKKQRVSGKKSLHPKEAPTPETWKDMLEIDLDDIGDFYRGCMPAAAAAYGNGTIAGDMLKPGLNKVITRLVEDAFLKAWDRTNGLIPEERTLRDGPTGFIKYGAK